MAKTPDYHQHLSELIKLQSCSSGNDIHELVSIFRLKEYNPNDHIFNNNDENNQIRFVCKGVLRSYDLDSDGNECNLFFSVEDDFIVGNLSPKMKCSYNKQALTNTILLTANFEEYHSLVLKKEHLLEFHVKVLANVHNKIGNRISKDFFSDSKKKYETFLKNYPGLLNRIPHYYIANYLGITPTQLSRVRKDFLR